MENAEASERTYLAVPFAERGEAKAAGARWDTQARCWYVSAGTSLESVQRWLRGPALSVSAGDPRSAFAAEMMSCGLVVPHGHPRITGDRWASVPLLGARRSQRSGSYRLWNVGDGYCGYCHNWKTGEGRFWSDADGRRLDPAQSAELRRVMATEQAAYRSRVLDAQRQAADRAARLIEQLMPATGSVPYVKRKQIPAFPGLLTDGRNGNAYVPAYDVTTGRLTALQRIPPVGPKMFGENERTGGPVVHVVGGRTGKPSDLRTLVASGKAVVVAEGYATAASLAGVLEQAVVCAFTSRNLASVASAIRREYPQVYIILAADNDRKTELGPHAKNPGIVAARQAAKAVGGEVMTPPFALGDPENGLSDFNDLLARSARRADAPQLIRDQMAAARRRLLHARSRQARAVSTGGRQELDRAPARVRGGRR